MPKGVRAGTEGWDPADLSDVRACKGCHRPMRHRDSPEELFPGTCRHGGEGHCTTCRARQTSLRRGGDPSSEQARVAAALRIAERVRERRQKLGITPDGRKLPRYVHGG